jgi:hypothetical protein
VIARLPWVGKVRKLQIQHGISKKRGA